MWPQISSRVEDPEDIYRSQQFPMHGPNRTLPALASQCAYSEPLPARHRTNSPFIIQPVLLYLRLWINQGASTFGVASVCGYLPWKWPGTARLGCPGLPAASAAPPPAAAGQCAETLAGAVLPVGLDPAVALPDHSCKAFVCSIAPDCTTVTQNSTTLATAIRKWLPNGHTIRCLSVHAAYASPPVANQPVAERSLPTW